MRSEDKAGAEYTPEQVQSPQIICLTKSTVGATASRHQTVAQDKIPGQRSAYDLRRHHCPCLSSEVPTHVSLPPPTLSPKLH